MLKNRISGIRIFTVLLLTAAVCFLTLPVFAWEDENSALITTLEDFNSAVANAQDGDVILVGDIEFGKMPSGMIQIPKNVTIKSGKSGNAVFTNATFSLSGTASGEAPLTVKFENIDFRGENYGSAFDPEDPPCVSSTLPDIMNTMCAGIFKLNLDVTYSSCSFEGYHYGYGGVISAIYPDETNRCGITLERCVFRNNAGKLGGCVYLSGEQNIKLKAERCIFEDNAAAAGGAIFASGASVSVKECVFKDNSYYAGGDDFTSGGAIATQETALDLDGSVFSGNVSGGSGGGVYCRILPFQTLTMRNCTVYGNEAVKDGGVSVSLSGTNLDTPAFAHVYFSSFVGNVSGEKTDLVGSDIINAFGCFVYEENIVDRTPDEENGYCLCISEENGGIVSDENGHIRLTGKGYEVPKERLQKLAGGKFSSGLGTFSVGDNYSESVVITVETSPRKSESVTVLYGEKISPAVPERKGYSFEGWKYSGFDGSGEENFFFGGSADGCRMEAVWKWRLSKNLYVIIIPASLAVLALIVLAVFAIKKKRPAAAPDNVLPEDWIERAIVKAETIETLSKREEEVLSKLLEGKSRKQIADELFVTEATIRKHSTSIYAKLGVHNRTELLYKLTK